MHIIFVSYNNLESNSGGHISNLANELAKRGVGITIFVPCNADAAPLRTVSRKHECLAFGDVNDWLMKSSLAVEETLLVAWTPRENVRHFVGSFRRRFACRYVVHMEDNEALLTATSLGFETDQLGRLPRAVLDASIPCDSSLAHPVHFERFVSTAHGATALIDSLFSITRPPRNHLVFWPGASPAFFGSKTVDFACRRSFGIKDNELLLAYTGNLHKANQSEIRSLYLATAILNRRGIKARLIRTGDDYVPVFPEPIAEVNRHVVTLGRLRDEVEVARVLSAADILVQPGRRDLFNEYRFPSKLPEFFATGRPVIMPNANLGRFVRDGEDCLLLKRGDAVEIADHITRLRSDPELCLRLSAASRRFALAHFCWPQISEKILLFYAQILATESL